MFCKNLLPQKEGQRGLCDKSQDAIFKQGWGKLWVILNQINAWTTGRCFPPASPAKFLFPVPRMSPDKQPSASTGWDSGAAAATKRPSGHRLWVCPRAGPCGTAGKGWERLPPSSPWPFLNVFRVGCSAGLPTPNCPLPWGGVCSSSVPSKRCCDTEQSKACPHGLLAPAASLGVALQHRPQLPVPRVQRKGTPGRVPFSCHYSRKDFWVEDKMGGIQDLAGNWRGVLAAGKGRVSVP